ncbi:MAG: DUF6057 family protein [Pseudoflavonifractor sp.]|nr:DUF6057 family protein [Alloprevotella sp.]MCM1116285.1 DUF6057 family protein [Pseudoflavonifractor sp.]
MKWIRLAAGLGLGVLYYIACQTWLAHIVFYRAEHSTFLFGRWYREQIVSAHGWAAYIDSWLSGLMANEMAGGAVMALLCMAVFFLFGWAWRALTRRPDTLGLSAAASVGVFIASMREADGSATAAWAAPAILAVIIIVAAIINRLAHRGSVKAWPWPGKRAQEMIEVGCIIAWAAAGYVVTLRGINVSERTMLLTERDYRAGNYASAIARADHYLSSGRTNKLMSLLRNLSLARQGELADHLLDYPLPMGAEALSFAWHSDSRESEYGALPYEAIGHINEAHRWESEALVVWGATPRRLEALARYNIAMGRPEVARKYLRHLANAPFKSALARKLSARADHPEASGLRHSLAGQGGEISHWANILDITPELEAICAADPTNDVARQYLLCELLLRNEVTRFAPLLPLYGPKGELPTLYQEALALLSLKPGADTTATAGISPAVSARFHEYMRRAAATPPDALAPTFGDTYWYYINNLSPYGHTAK